MAKDIQQYLDSVKKTIKETVSLKFITRHEGLYTC